MIVRAACAQFAPRKAEVQENLARIAEITAQCASELVDLVVFPETATSGYFLEGGVIEGALTADQLRIEIETKIVKVSRAIDIVIGFYELADGNLFNSCAYFEWDGKALQIRHVYRKFFLPTYGVFDEERFVSRGHELGVFETRFGRVALLICEDVWHSVLPTLCAVAGATLFIVPGASPGRGFQSEKPGNVLQYERLLTAISEEHNVFCINSMLCGFEGGKGFAGASMFVNPMGEIVAQGPIQEEHLLINDLDLSTISVARAQSPLLSDLRDVWGDVVQLSQELL